MIEISAMDLRTVALSISFIVLSLSSLTHAVTPEQMDKLGVTCNGTKADIEVMKELKVPSTETGKCLMRCLTDLYKMFDDQGRYNLENVEASLRTAWPKKPEKDVPVIAKYCEEKLRNSPPEKLKTCERSYDTMLCINTKARELGWFN